MSSKNYLDFSLNTKGLLYFLKLLNHKSSHFHKDLRTRRENAFIHSSDYLFSNVGQVCKTYEMNETFSTRNMCVTQSSLKALKKEDLWGE